VYVRLEDEDVVDEEAVEETSSQFEERLLTLLFEVLREELSRGPTVSTPADAGGAT